ELEQVTALKKSLAVMLGVLATVHAPAPEVDVTRDPVRTAGDDGTTPAPVPLRWVSAGGAGPRPCQAVVTAAVAVRAGCAATTRVGVSGARSSSVAAAMNRARIAWNRTFSALGIGMT